MAVQTGIAGNKTPAPVAVQTGVAGNNSVEAGRATTARASAINGSNIFHVTVALLLVVFGFTLASQNLSFFWKLVTGFGLIIVGGKFAAVKGYDKYRGAWPQVFRGLGWVVVAATLLMSGIGQWTGSVAKGVDTAAFCAVEENKNDARCKKAVEATVVQNVAQPAVRETIAPHVASVEARPVILDEMSYEMKAIGKFKPITLNVSGQSRVGPLNQYDGSCFYVIKTGVGKMQVYSRPDFTSKPVPAIMDGNGVGVAKWGHDGPAFQVFYEAVEGTITLEIERREGNNSCR